MHWTVVHAASSAEHQRKLKGRRARRGERLEDLRSACNEMLGAIRQEVEDANAAEQIFSKLLCYPLEISAGGRDAKDLEALLASLSAKPGRKR